MPGQRGLASWYGGRFHGRRTANGERFDMYALTAAHRTLPMSSQVRVRNPANGRSVVVRINDRGPFHGGRMIDLSYAAARQIGLLHGVGMVEMRTLALAGTGPERSGGEPAGRTPGAEPDTRAAQQSALQAPGDGDAATAPTVASLAQPRAEMPRAAGLRRAATSSPAEHGVGSRNDTRDTMARNGPSRRFEARTPVRHASARVTATLPMALPQQQVVARVPVPGSSTVSGYTPVAFRSR